MRGRLADLEAGFKDREAMEVLSEEGGNRMEENEIGKLRDSVAEIKLAQERARHETENKMRDQSDAVAGLGGDLKGLLSSVQAIVSHVKKRDEEVVGLAGVIRGVLDRTAKLSTLATQIAERPTESRVRELMTECIRDPNSPACRTVASMVQTAVAETGTEQGILLKSDEGNHTVPHPTWNDVLSCKDGCQDGICEALPEHPELLSRALKTLGGKSKKKLAKTLADAGYGITDRPKDFNIRLIKP